MIYSYDGEELESAYSLLEELDTAYDVGANVVYEKTPYDPYLENRLLLFEDSFLGNSLNENNWTVEVGNVRGDCFYRARNVCIEDEKLVCIAKKENHLTYSWTQGSINSVGKRSWMYGRFEAKIKFPGEIGSFPALWCLGNSGGEHYTDDNGISAYQGQQEGDAGSESWPICGEIDITEGIPGNTNRPPCNLWGTDGNSLGSTNFISDINTKEWHIYSMEWTPTYMAMLIDNIEYKRWVFSDYDYDIVKTYVTHPMGIIIGLATGSSSGTPSQSATEFKMYTDWVRVYAPVGVTQEIPVTDISIPSTFTLKKGYRKYFVPQIQPLDATNQHVNWLSSDTSVVQVDRGWVYGINYGTAIITATTDNGETSACTVTVVDVL